MTVDVAPAGPHHRRAQGSDARGLVFSDAWLVATAPTRTFDRLASDDPHGSWTRTIGAITAGLVVLATALTVLATRAVPLPTLVSLAVCWSFVPLFQLAAAAVACRSAPAARVSTRRAIQLVFTAHLPWTLWLSGVAFAALWTESGPGFVQALVTFIIPAAWTPLLLAAFCRTVLGCSPTEARRRTALHQALTWAAIVLFAIGSIQPWARY